MSRFIEVAMEAARNTGQYLLDNRGKISSEDVNEKAANDFVTDIDKNAEQMIVDSILENFPDHRILAEEGSFQDTGNEYRWIIDPLDGTKNYIQNIPIFGVSIALQRKNEIVAGVVFDAVHDELYSAEKGSGAFCNEKPIQVSSRDFSISLIATGFPHKMKRYLPTYMLAFEEIFLKCSGMRRCGSAALDLCHTAAGRYEGFWEIGLSQWDMASGSLLITESGGVISDFSGGQNFLGSGFVVAGNPEAHKMLLDILKYHFSSI